jgi:hypothetical protein
LQSGRIDVPLELRAILARRATVFLPNEVEWSSDATAPTGALRIFKKQLVEGVGLPVFSLFASEEGGAKASSSLWLRLATTTATMRLKPSANWGLHVLHFLHLWCTFSGSPPTVPGTSLQIVGTCFFIALPDVWRYK